MRKPFIPLLISALAFNAKKGVDVSIKTDKDGMMEYLKRKERLEMGNRPSKRKMKKRRGRA